MMFLLSLASIFSVYPKIFREILRNEQEKRKNHGGKLPKDFIYLPSDQEWQEKVYQRLLEIQKRVNYAIENGLDVDAIENKKEKPTWDPFSVLETNTKPKTSTKRDERPVVRNRCVLDHPVEYIDIGLFGTWTLDCIANAGKLLRKPPIPVHFDDEHEMRKVYSLIYDVFRYKHVLSQTLDDIAFYGYYPDLKRQENRVWLLLFELYTRHFVRRSSEETKLEEELFKEADLNIVSHALWDKRIRLAAAISRLRIKNKALQLSQLLPSHLQNEKVAIAAANPIVSGWMNPFKIKDKESAMRQLSEMGLKEVDQCGSLNEKPLLTNQYKWDKVCPLFMSCLPNDRSDFCKSDLVRNNVFVMQDRTFSIAPAILSRLLDHFQLDGDIVQTHVSSPRSTAYLAALFYSVNRVNDFIAFGAGSSLDEYKEYIDALGINNIRLFSDNFCSLPLESQILETVVGIFATPPNSFSGVSDPIDLICSRGGDLSMLEVLTESDISKDGKKRVAQILEEQRETLRLAMSRPQVQFVLYETHSIVGSENQDMVEKSVDIINRCAFEKHLEAYKEKKRLEALAEAEAANIPSAAFGTSSSSPRKRPNTTTTTVGGSSSNFSGIPTDVHSGGGGGNRDSARVRAGKMSRTNSIYSDSMNSMAQTDCNTIFGSNFGGTGGSGICVNLGEDYSHVVKVPKTDEFLITEVPDVCLNQDGCVDFPSMGCYVSLIQRKQLTRLDAKYLIKMAENRGLFGSSDPKKSAKSKNLKKVEKKPEKKLGSASSTERHSKTHKTDIDTLIHRLNQPTHASYIRSNLQRISYLEKQSLSFNYTQRECPRHNRCNENETPCVASTELNTRARKWWQETAKYITAIRGNDQNKAGGNSDKSIKNNNTSKVLPPLKLSRSIPTADSPNNLINKFNYLKTKSPRTLKKVPYPVTVVHLGLNDYFQHNNGNTRSNLGAPQRRESGYWTV